MRGLKTSDETLAAARAFAEDVGKTCIVVERDVAGFVTTRLISALAMEAIALYESGVASAEDIDLACQLGFGHAMGPLATTDLTGVDILRHATLNIHAETGDPKFYPPELLSRMVDAGDLGRKTGRGFFRTTPDPTPDPTPIAPSYGRSARAHRVDPDRSLERPPVVKSGTGRGPGAECVIAYQTRVGLLLGHARATDPLAAASLPVQAVRGPTGDQAGRFTCARPGQSRPAAVPARRVLGPRRPGRPVPRHRRGAR